MTWDSDAQRRAVLRLNEIDDFENDNLDLIRSTIDEIGRVGRDKEPTRELLHSVALVLLDMVADTHLLWSVDLPGIEDRIGRLERATGLDALDDEKGTPTPIETHPAGGGEDTLMERSTGKDEEENTPYPPEKFYPRHGPLGLRDIPSGSPKKKLDLDGWAIWDPGCGLDRPAGYKGHELVDIVFRSGAVAMGHSADSVVWDEYGSASIFRYRLHVPADPDNGPDGAFGPDVVEGLNPVTVRLWKDVCAAADAHWMAGKDARFTLAVREIVLGALRRSGLL